MDKLNLKYWHDNYDNVTIGALHHKDSLDIVNLNIIAKKINQNIKESELQTFKSYDEFKENICFEKRYIIISYIPYPFKACPEKEYLLNTDSIFPLILAYPNVFFLLVNDFAYVHNEFSLSKNLKEDVFKKKLRSINLSLKKYKSLFEYSFISSQQIHKINNDYISLLNLISKSSIFDPTGIRRFIQDLIYDKVENECFQIRNSAIVIDDDKYFAEELSYYLYRLNISPLMITDLESINIFEKLCINSENGNWKHPIISNVVFFSDQNIKFSEIKTGTEVFKNLSEQTIITTGQSGLFRDKSFSYISKPIKGIYHLKEEIDRIKNNSEFKKQYLNNDINYLRFSKNKGHQGVSFELSNISNQLFKAFHSSNQFFYSQIILIDIYHLSKGRNGTQVCIALEKLYESETDFQLKRYPYHKQYTSKEIEEITQSFYYAFEEPDENKIPKTLHKQTVDRLEPLFFMERLFNNLIHNVSDTVGFNVSYKLFRKQRLMCRQNIRLLSIQSKKRKFYLRIYKLFTYPRNFIFLLRRCFYTFQGTLTIWSFSFILFFVFYFLFGQPIGNKFQHSFLPALLNSFVSSFALSLDDKVFGLILFGKEIWFHIFRAAQNIISLVCFAFLINNLIEKLHK